jgi:ferrous iron transport protein A
MGMGLMPDVELEVMSQTSTGATIVAIADQRLGLGEDMGRGIMTIAIGQSTDRALVTLKLRDAAIGANLQVVGYEPTGREYKRKLLAMGLTPGTQLQVKRFAPLGDPTEIEVRGFRLSLRKHEADALIVTTI